MGQILDFVPNHMGVGGADNPLWLDVLEWGPDAEYAGWFDIDWDPERPHLQNKILVPFLGDQYGVELDRGKLQLQFDERDGSFAVWAYDTHKLPICPPHYGRISRRWPSAIRAAGRRLRSLPNWRPRMAAARGQLKIELAQLAGDAPTCGPPSRRSVPFQGRPGEPSSWTHLDSLIRDQHWRLAHFRVAADDINYRRFFNINDLAGLRDGTAGSVRSRASALASAGQGRHARRAAHRSHRRVVRPQGYLRRLRERLTARAADHFYLVVEKILAAHERLREDWPVDGTTGYDFLNQVLGLLVDPGGGRSPSRAATPSSPASARLRAKSCTSASCTSWKMKWPAS